MEKILIVEDDAGISDFVNAELKHEGYTDVQLSNFLKKKNQILFFWI